MLDLKGKRVIELGAGTGIVGILAARLGTLDQRFPNQSSGHTGRIYIFVLSQLPEHLTQAIRSFEYLNTLQVC